MTSPLKFPFGKFPLGKFLSGQLLTRAFVPVFTLLSVTSAFAQDQPQTRPLAPAGKVQAGKAQADTGQADTGWTLLLGAGVALSPNYLGDDRYSVSTLPYIRVTKGERFFASVQEGLGYAVIKNDRFRAGPLASVEFGRDEDGGGPFRVAGSKTNDLIGLGDIDSTVSLGGFAEMNFGKLALTSKAGKALGGHDGLTANIGLRYKSVLTGYGPPLIYSVGPSLDFGDTRYTNAYFGVTAQQSENSGLTPFTASGGPSRIGLSANGIVPLTDTLSANIVLNVSRLLGDAADSALVTERGSRDQAFGGLFLARKF